MGAISSSSICGGSGSMTTTEQERNGNEVYLPSSYYPYHINHIQNSEYHPRTYNTAYTQDTEQAEFNTQIIANIPSMSTHPALSQTYQQPKYSHLQQQQQQHQLGIYPNGSNINMNKQLGMKDQNLDSTMHQIYGSNTKEILSPYNYNSQNQLTYTTPFLHQPPSKLLLPSPKLNQLMDSVAIKEQQKSYSERIFKLAELVTFAPVLRLTVLASANLKKDQILTINAQGLLNGIRNERDGYVFFGCKKKAKRMNKLVKQSQVINDFIIPPTDPQQAKQQRGRHFQIRYDIKNNFYTIVDLGVGFGAFKKLTIPHILRNHDLLNFGLTLCTIKFISKDNPNKSFSQKTFQNKEDIILKAQFFGGNSNGEVYELDPKEYQEITIGRSENCSLAFKDKLISKVQCLLTFNSNHGWVLKDGDGSLPSTNGSWIYLQKEEQIVDGMIIKANQTVFQASIH